MGNDRRKSFDLTTTDPQIVIEVVVRYATPNAGNDYRQGYWVTISPVKIEKDFRITGAESIVNHFVMAAKRFSQKQFDALFNDVRYVVLNGHIEDVWVKEVNRVAEESGLRITYWENLIKDRPKFNSIIDAYS